MKVLLSLFLVFAMFTATVAPASAATSSKQLTITVAPADLTVTTTTLPSGKVGTTYTATLTASGGVAPYSWSLTTGSVLPPGLSLSSAGVISGTPTSAGTFSFTAQVTDSSGVTSFLHVVWKADRNA